MIRALLPWLVPSITTAGLWFRYEPTLRLAPAVYIIGLLIDHLVRADEARRESATANRQSSIIFLGVPLYASLLLAALNMASAVCIGDLAQRDELYALIVCAGMVAGLFAVPVAHELMHRDGHLPRTLSVVQLIMIGYPHFHVEHVEGHHVNVGTTRDPATARLGESLYAFIPRSVLGGFRHAWSHERHRLRHLGHTPWCFHNRVLWPTLALIVFVVLVQKTLGSCAVLFFVGQCAVAVMMLETMNYVEHYGVTRGPVDPIRCQHAWDSAAYFSNAIMFNLPRHAEHHVNSAPPHVKLQLNGARLLPGGYFAMFTLALFPPLWRYVMDPLAIAAMGNSDAYKTINR